MSSATYLPERTHKKPARRHTTRKTTVRPFNFGSLTKPSEKNELGPESEVKSKLVVAHQPETDGSENQSVTSSQLLLSSLLSKLQTEILGDKENKENEVISQPLLKNSNTVKSSGKTLNNILTVSEKAVQGRHESGTQVLTTPIQDSTNISLQKSPAVLVHKLVLSPKIIDNVSSPFRVSKKPDCSVSGNPQVSSPGSPSLIKVTENPALPKKSLQIVSSNLSNIPTTIELTERDTSHSAPACQSSSSSSSETLSSLETQVLVSSLAKSSNSNALSTLQQPPGQLCPIPEECVRALSYTTALPYPNNDTSENVPKPVSCDKLVTESPAKSCSSNRQSPIRKPDTSSKKTASKISSKCNYTSNVTKTDEENIPSKSSTLNQSSTISSNGTEFVLTKSKPVFGKESPAPSKVNGPELMYKESTKQLSRETCIEPNSSSVISEKQTSAVVDGDAAKQSQAEALIHVNLSQDRTKTKKRLSSSALCIEQKTQPFEKSEKMLLSKSYQEMKEKTPEETLQSISEFLYQPEKVIETHRKESPVKSGSVSVPSVSKPEEVPSYEMSKNDSALKSSVKIVSGRVEPETPGNNSGPELPASSPPSKNLEIVLFPKTSRKHSPVNASTKAISSAGKTDAPIKESESDLIISVSTPSELLKVLSPKTSRKDSPVKSGANTLSLAAKPRKELGSEMSVSVSSVSKPEKVPSYKISRNESALRSIVKVVSGRAKPGTPENNLGPELPALKLPSKNPEIVSFPKTSRKHSPVNASVKTISSVGKTDDPIKESESELIVSASTPSKLQKELSPKTLRKDSPVKSGATIRADARISRMKSAAELPLSGPSINQNEGEKLKENAVVLSFESNIQSPVKSKSLSPGIASLLKEPIGSENLNILSESGSASSKELGNTSIVTMNVSSKKDLSRETSVHLNLNEKPERDRLVKEAPNPPPNDTVVSKISRKKSNVSKKLDFTVDSSKPSPALSFSNSNNCKEGLSVNKPVSVNAVTRTDHNLRSPNSKTRKGTSSTGNIGSSSDDANRKDINVPEALSQRSRASTKKVSIFPRKLPSKSNSKETPSGPDMGQQLPTYEPPQVGTSLNPGMIKDGSKKGSPVKKRPTVLSGDQIQNGMNISPTVSPKSVCLPKKMKLDAEHLMLSSSSDSESEAKKDNRVVLVGGKMSSTPKPAASNNRLPCKRKISEFFEGVDVSSDNTLKKSIIGNNTGKKSKKHLEFRSRTQEKPLKDVSANTRSYNRKRRPTGILNSGKSSTRTAQNTVSKDKVVKTKVSSTDQSENPPIEQIASKKRGKKIPEKCTEQKSLLSAPVQSKLRLDGPEESDSDQRQTEKNLDIEEEDEQNGIESVQQQNTLESDHSENLEPVGCLASEDEDISRYLLHSLDYDPEDLLDEVHKFQLKLRVSTKGVWPLKMEKKPRKKVKPKSKQDAGLIRYWMGHPSNPRPKKPLDLDVFATALEEAILEMREKISERKYEFLLKYQADVEFELHKDIEKVERFILGQKKIKTLEKRIQHLQEVHRTQLESN